MDDEERWLNNRQTEILYGSTLRRARHGSVQPARIDQHGGAERVVKKRRSALKHVEKKKNMRRVAGRLQQQ